MLISDFPIYEGQNYAPVKPLMELQQASQPKQDDITSQLKAKYDDLEQREKPVFEAIAETAYLISSFVQGKQIWERNWFNGGNWELAVAPKDSNPNKVRSFNKMQFQVSQMIEDIISSNPDFEPEDMFKSYDFEKQVKASKAVWNYYDRKFYQGQKGAWFNTQQAHALITSGMAIEELVYDATAKAFTAFREIWGEQPVVVDAGGGECFNCGYQGQSDTFHQWDDPNRAKEYAEMQEAAKAGDSEAITALQTQPLATLPQCPNCGSFEADVRDPQTEMFPTVVGLEQYQLGDFRLNNLPIQSVRFDVSCRPEDSSYFIDKQYFPLSKIKRLFGRDIHIGDGGGGDRCLDLLLKMARIGASIGGARVELGGTSRQPRTTTLIRMSLTADELADIDIPNGGDLQTISGGTLTPGQTLADICPDGATVVGFDELNHIYGIWPITHKRRISSATYFSKANAGTGRGAEDLTEIQKRWNRIDSQQQAAIDGASPGYAFVEGSVDEKHVKRIGWPNAKIPVRREFFNITKDVKNFVQQFNPQMVAPQFFAYATELEKMMQMTAHNVSMSGAVFDANNNTATGARILEATAQRITIPFLESKAGMRLGTVRNLLAGYKDCFSAVTRKFSLGGKRHTSQTEVTGDDINPDIAFIVQENSHIPQNFYLRKADYLGFANAVMALAPQGGYLVLKQADPKTMNTVAKVFNVDLGEDDYDEITEICRLRLENAFELAMMFAGLIQVSAAIASAAPMQPAPMDPQNGSVPPTPQPGMNNPLTANANGNTIPSVEGGQAPQQVGQGVAEPVDSPQNQFYDLIFSHLDLPIRPAERNQKGKADWFRDFLDTQEGLKLSSQQRDICFEFIWQHENAALTNQAAETASTSMANLAATAPAMALQAKGAQMLQMGNQSGQAATENSNSPEGNNLATAPA